MRRRNDVCEVTAVPKKKYRVDLRITCSDITWRRWVFFFSQCFFLVLPYFRDFFLLLKILFLYQCVFPGFSS